MIMDQVNADLKRQNAVLKTVILILCMMLMSIFLMGQDISSSQNNDQDTISIAGTILKIGMEKTQVLDTLGKYHFLKKWRNTDYDAYGIDTKMSESVGSVQFHNNKLFVVNKSWSNNDQSDPVNLGNNLFSALSKYFGSKGRSATVNTVSIKEPSTRTDIIDISFGRRKISIYINHDILLSGIYSNTVRGVGINETLSGFNKTLKSN